MSLWFGGLGDHPLCNFDIKYIILSYIKCQPVGPLGLDGYLVPSYSNQVKIIISFDAKVVISCSFDSSECTNI